MRNMEPLIGDAILALGIKGGWTTSNGKIVKWFADKPQPSQSEIDAKLAELIVEFNAQEYARNRASAFPSIGEQLDMQYWDQVNGTTTWKDAVAKVKSDNPKE